MINVKQFVYDKLNTNVTLSWLVGDRIYPQIMPQDNKVRPIVIYSRISPWKMDLKGIRNEYFQVSVRWKKIVENEAIMGVVASSFNGLKEPPVKHCDIQRVDESFDPDTQTFGNHVTVHIKMFDHDI